jgi:glycosyltransferase involved in cell wall biosynthesis
MDDYYFALVARRKRITFMTTTIKKVLFISWDGMTDSLGQSQVLPYLIGLTNNNYEFHIISPEKPEAYIKGKEVIEKLIAPYKITWHPLTYLDKIPVISPIINVKNIRKKAESLHLQHHFTFIHSRSYVPSIVSLYMYKKYGLKYIFDMRGFWADERVDGKLWNLRNPLFNYIYKYFKKKEKEFMLTANAVVCLTEKAKHEMLSWNYMANYKKEITVIPCCADLNVFNKENIDETKLKTFKNELKIKNDDFILMYLGSIGTWYMLDEMIEFFSVLKQQHSKAKFLFITKDEHSRILEVAEKYNVKEAIILRSGARAEIPYLISVSNCSIFFILPSYSKMASSPTKQAEIMAMGIPIICNKNIGDTDKLITDYHSGYIVDDFNHSSYLKTVNDIFNSNKFDKINTINGAKQYFSLSNGVQKFRKIYDLIN